jgi:hypothetical protein
MHDLEYAGEFEIDSPFSEVEEMEEAARLLEITDEAELDQFIGNLLKKAAKASGSVLKPPVGCVVGGYGKGAIKKALPGIGSAVGGFPVPGVGPANGGQVASRAGQLLGLELEVSALKTRSLRLPSGSFVSSARPLRRRRTRPGCVPARPRPSRPSSQLLGSMLRACFEPGTAMTPQRRSIWQANSKRRVRLAKSRRWKKPRACSKLPTKPPRLR